MLQKCFRFYFYLNFNIQSSNIKSTYPSLVPPCGQWTDGEVDIEEPFTGVLHPAALPAPTALYTVHCPLQHVHCHCSAASHTNNPHL